MQRPRADCEDDPDPGTRTSKKMGLANEPRLDDHQGPLGRVGTNLHCGLRLPQGQQENAHDEMRNFSRSAGCTYCAVAAGGSTTTPPGSEIVTVPSAYYRATEYYVVRDPSTKQCSVTSAKPTSSTTMVVVGTTAYTTGRKADTAITTVCK